MAFAVNVEQWRLVDGYDTYEVSSHGRVRNNKTDKIILKSGIRCGYNNVVLCKDGKTKRWNIHYLVCFAFCENPNNYNIVEHIDNNKLNNMFNNLRWVYTSKNSELRTKAKNDADMRGIYHDQYAWSARWCDNVGHMFSKNFSIKTFGHEKARTLAISCRKEKEVEFGYLEN